MIQLVGNIFTGLFAGLNWADEVNGVVAKLSEVINAEGGQFEKSFPAYYNPAATNCNKAGYVACLPDSKKMSVIYLEDRGTRVSSIDANFRNFESDVRAVFWVNYKLINPTLYDPTRLIYEALDLVPFNVGVYGFMSKVRIEPQGMPEKDIILSPYTYPYVDAQMITHPYDIFAIDFKVSYSLAKGCLDPINIDPSC